MIINAWPAATASPTTTAMLIIVPCMGAGTGLVPSGPRLAPPNRSVARSCRRPASPADLRHRPGRRPAACRSTAMPRSRPPGNRAWMQPGRGRDQPMACSSTKRVWTLSARTSLWASRRAGRRCCSPRPRCGTLRAHDRPWPPRREAGRRTVHDQLGEQRTALRSSGNPHSRKRRPGPRARGQLEDRERAAAGLGRPVLRHGLQVHASLDRVPARPGVAVPVLPGRATGPPHCVVTKSRPETSSVTVCSTCSRALPSMKKSRSVVVHQELHGSEAAIFPGRGRGNGRGDDPRGAAGARSELGAISTTFWLRAAGCIRGRPGRRSAFAVADDLDLDVARAADQTLGIEVAVAERRLGLRAGAREGVEDLASALHRPHAPAAATGDGLSAPCRTSRAS